MQFLKPEEEPLFVVQLQIYFDRIDESMIEIEPIKEFVPHPYGNSKPEDFNILYHVRLRPAKPVISPEEKAKLRKMKRAAAPS